MNIEVHFNIESTDFVSEMIFKRSQKVQLQILVLILHSILSSGEHNLSITAENHKHNLEL